MIATLNERVSYKRRGCNRDHGTVTEVIGVTDEMSPTFWVRVNWDGCGSCMYDARQLQVKRGRKYIPYLQVTT